MRRQPVAYPMPTDFGMLYLRLFPKTILTYVMPQKTIPGADITNVIAGANVVKFVDLQAFEERERLSRI